MSQEVQVERAAVALLKVHGVVFMRVLWIVTRVVVALLAAHKGVHFAYQGF